MRAIDDLVVCETVDEFIGALAKHFDSRPYGVKKYRKKSYIDLTCTFDIETYAKAYKVQRMGWIYSLQVNIDGVNAVFRYVEDFLECVERLIEEFKISDERRLVFYVHNLGYEYYWLSQIFQYHWNNDEGQPKGIFTARTKPLTLLFDNGIELRDSFKLFQKSLYYATEKVPHRKALGDISHSKRHTPDTYLTDDEFRYIVYDVQGLYEAIEQLKADYHYSQVSIPYTNTGRVRERMDNVIRKDTKAKKKMKELILNKEALTLAYHVSGGGDTHANRLKAGKTWENCNSYDIKSAHPSQMLLEPYPSGIPYKFYGSFKELERKRRTGYGWIAHLRIYDFECREECPNPTLSISKTIGRVTEKNRITGYDNGRILGADFIECYMDSNDWQRFKVAYRHGKVDIVNAVIFKLAPLPVSFRKVVLEDFKTKENTEKNSVDYTFSKICINTYFGVCDQRKIRDTFSINISSMGIESSKTTWEKNLESASEEEVADAQKNAYPYLWGLWTASLTRLALFKIQIIVGWDKILYWDTDSVKYVGAKVPAVERYNSEIIARGKKLGAYVIGRKGTPVFIGVAEDEHPDNEYGYLEFRALHAKCYAATVQKQYKTASGKIRSRRVVESTIAGVNKEAGRKALTLHGKPDLGKLSVGLIINNAGGFSLSYESRPIHIETRFKRPTMAASFIIMTPRRYEIIDTNLKAETQLPVMEIDTGIF